MDWSAIELSLRLSTLTTLLLLILGLPLASWLAFSRSAMEVFRRSRRSLAYCQSLFQFGDRTMRGGVAAQGDHPWDAMLPRRPGKELQRFSNSGT